MGPRVAGGELLRYRGFADLGNLAPERTTEKEAVENLPEGFAASTYRPSRVHARCTPRSGEQGTPPDDQNGPSFRPVRVVSLESPGWVVRLSLDGPARVGDDPTGRVSVVLHGEIYEPGVSGPSDLARRFIERGESLLDDLNGSFALIVLDREADRLFVATDRVGSRRIFCSDDKDGYTLSSDLREQPTDRYPLDPIGVGWFLASGACINRRTPYEGVGTLGPAQVHELTPDGIRSREYWSYAIREPEGPVDEDQLAAELRERLVEAVRRRVDDGSELFFSLSGGHDCRGIVIALAASLGITDVRAFSYQYGEGKEGGDALVAARIAREAGFSHRTLLSYRGDLLAQMSMEAHLGEGMLQATEVDIWPEMIAEFERAARPVLLVGDEYHGGPAEQDDSRGKFLYGLRYRGIGIPGPAGRHFPPALARRSTEGL